MSEKAVKVTGTQVKELLAKAVGGIYVRKNSWHNAVTGYFHEDNYVVTDERLQMEINKVTTVN